MGSAHAKAYHEIDNYELVGLVSRSSKRRSPLAKKLGGIPEFDDFDNKIAEFYELISIS